MINEFRVTKDFLSRVREDIFRPHPFAHERVGFIYCQSINKGGLILASRYSPIADDMYVEDRFLGAKFSGEVIRVALQSSIKERYSVFHVHLHEHFGEPELSTVDTRSIIEIANSLTEINSGVDHGCILLSEDYCKAYVIDRGRQKLNPIAVSVIGIPIQLFPYQEVL